MIGKRFGRLTVVGQAEGIKGAYRLWKCSCDCGGEKVVPTNCLSRGITKSCGCLAQESRHSRLIDMTGQRFGRLTVKKYLGGKLWLCVCECGAETTVNRDNLKSGRTKSCGCFNVDALRNRPKLLLSDNPKWKGGKKHDHRSGYVFVMMKDHPRADRGGYIHEHHAVMEVMLGRMLKPGEVVHHCNRVRGDNRPFNLRLFKSESEHQKYHMRIREQRKHEEGGQS